MATTKIIDYVGLGLGVFGMLLFLTMFFTSGAISDLGKAFLGFFFFASLGGAAYFGHKVYLT